LLPPCKTDGKTTSSVLENTETHGMTPRVEGFRVRSVFGMNAAKAVMGT